MNRAERRRAARALPRRSLVTFADDVRYYGLTRAQAADWSLRLSRYQGQRARVMLDRAGRNARRVDVALRVFYVAVAVVAVSMLVRWLG